MATSAASWTSNAPDLPGPTSGPAGPGRRFAAWLIDSIVAAPVLFVALLVGSALFPTEGEEATDAALWTTVAAFAFAMGAYYAVLEGIHGATLGKRALNLRVVDDTGGPPGFRRGLGRYLLRYLSGAAVGLGYLVGLISADRRTWHDTITKTHVLGPGGRGPAAALVQGAVLDEPAAAPTSAVEAEPVPPSGSAAPQTGATLEARQFEEVAEALARASHWPEAGVLLEVVAEHVDASATIQSARALIRGGAPDRALMIVNRALVGDADDGTLHALRARCLNARRDPGGAAEALAEARRLAPQAVDTWIADAWCSSDPAHARESAAAAVEAAPDRIDAHHALIGALVRQKDDEAWEAALRRAAELAPEDPTFPLEIGRARQLAKDRTAAAESYVRALRLAPQLEAALQELLGLLRPLARRRRSQVYLTSLLFSPFVFGLLRSAGAAEAVAVVAAPFVLIVGAALFARRRSHRRRAHSAEVLTWVDHLRWVAGRDHLEAVAGSLRPLLRLGARSPVPSPSSAVTEPSRCFCAETVRLYGPPGVAYARQHLGHVTDLGVAGALFGCPSTRARWVGIEGGFLGPEGTPAVVVRVRETLERPAADRTYGQYL